MHPSELKEMLTAEDVSFLLRANCNLYGNIRTLSMRYVRDYVERFPCLLMCSGVMFTFLDIVGAVYKELYLQYDSLSHTLRLPYSSRTLIFPVEKACKQEIFRFLIKLLEELYIKGAVSNEAQLVAVFQEYIYVTLSRQPSDSLAHFGVSFFLNIYANYKNFDGGSLVFRQPLNYLVNLSEFNQQVGKLIAQRTFFEGHASIGCVANTINELIDKSTKMKDTIESL